MSVFAQLPAGGPGMEEGDSAQYLEAEGHPWGQGGRKAALSAMCLLPWTSATW